MLVLWKEEGELVVLKWCSLAWVVAGTTKQDKMHLVAVAYLLKSTNQENHTIPTKKQYFNVDIEKHLKRTRLRRLQSSLLGQLFQDFPKACT